MSVPCAFPSHCVLANVVSHLAVAMFSPTIGAQNLTGGLVGKV